MKISEVQYISGTFFSDLKKDPEFAPDKLRRNAIFCFHSKTKNPNFAFPKLRCVRDSNP